MITCIVGVAAFVIGLAMGVLITAVLAAGSGNIKDDVDDVDDIDDVDYWDLK